MVFEKIEGQKGFKDRRIYKYIKEMSVCAYEKNLKYYYNCVQDAMNELFEEDFDWYDEEDALKEERFMEKMWDKYDDGDVEMAEYIFEMTYTDKEKQEFIEKRYLPCGYYIREFDCYCDTNIWGNISFEYCGECMMVDLGFY